MAKFLVQVEEMIRDEFNRRRLEEQENKKDRTIGVGYPVYDEREILEALDSLLDLRLSQGLKTERFEREFAEYVGTKYAVAVNSGSSANLLAISALFETGNLKKGDEVIVPASTFPTVSSPIYQLGLVPVYVDVSPKSWCMDPQQIKYAISDRSKLIMPVHNLGFPADMQEIMEIAEKHNLLVLEDCCEAHGAECNGRKVGSFGALSTLSFFVAHNITTGEGGMVFTSNAHYENMLRSLREFGRSRNIKERYVSVGNLKDYDVRYIFTSLGFNLRMTDIIASLGIVQLSKLNELNRIRNNHAKRLDKALKQYDAYLGVSKTEGDEFSSYYTYPIFVRDTAPFSRRDICEFLEENRIETRAMMGGCLPDQPGFQNLKHRIVGNLPIARIVRDRVFFIGCHAGISSEDIDYIISVFERFMSSRT